MDKVGVVPDARGLEAQMHLIPPKAGKMAK